MSNKISYVLEVLDKYSTNTRKFKKEIKSLETSIDSLSKKLSITSLNVGKLGAGLGLTQTIRQTDSLKRNIDGLNRSSQQSVNIAQQHARVLSANSRRAYAGAFTPKRTSYEPQLTQPQQPSRRGGFFAGGDGVSFTNVAKGIGYYRAIDMAVSAPSKIRDVTVEMDSLRAGLSALIPTVKGMEKATAESEVAYLKNVSNKYGFAFSDVAPSYLKLMGTGGKTDAALIKGLLENVGGYGGLIGMSGPALEGTMRGFQDMLTKQVLNAQEVNLQMQQMPGSKPMLHKAFKRFAEKKGAKDITDENVSARFTEAMATGRLPSVDILREFVQVLNEMFGEEMIKKSFKLRNEEQRLRNAFQELGDQIGLLTYDAQIGTVKGLASITKQVTASLLNVSQSFGILDNAMKDSNLYKISKGIGVGLYKVATEGVNELIKAPFKFASAGGGLIASTLTNDKEGRKEVQREFRNYYFGNDNQSAINNSIANDSQKIEITIKSNDNIKVEDVKSSRPSTVKAGQK